MATVNGDRLSKEAAAKLIDLIEQFATARGSRLIHARARLLAFIDSLTVEPPVEQHFVCGECGYEWPMNMFGAPWLRRRHGEQFRNDETCTGYFTLVPHHPTPCYCRSYGPARCPQHAHVEPPAWADAPGEETSRD